MCRNNAPTYTSYKTVIHIYSCTVQHLYKRHVALGDTSVVMLPQACHGTHGLSKAKTFGSVGHSNLFPCPSIQTCIHIHFLLKCCAIAVPVSDTFSLVCDNNCVIKRQYGLCEGWTFIGRHHYINDTEDMFLTQRIAKHWMIVKNGQYRRSVDREIVYVAKWVVRKKNGANEPMTSKRPVLIVLPSDLL